MEKKYDRKFLKIACRHHIFELIIAAIYSELFGCNVGPSVQIFVSFRKVFDQLKLDKIKRCSIEKHLKSSEIRELSSFIEDQKLRNQKRADFYELLNLCQLFICGQDESETILIKQPGADHHARWMSKAIYFLKIYLLRDQLKKISSFKFDIEKVEQFCLFFIKYLLKIWFTCTVASRAPVNDLLFIQNLIKDQKKNNLCSVALNKFKNHHWYINSNLVALSLFDSRLPNSTKNLMRRNINNSPKVVDINSKTSIAELIDRNSLDFFKICNLDYDFLSVNSNEWDTIESFINCRTFVDSLQVTNDSAERGCALLSRYSNSIIQSNDCSNLFQIVELDTKRRKSCKKINYN